MAVRRGSDPAIERSPRGHGRDPGIGAARRTGSSASRKRSESASVLVQDHHGVLLTSEVQPDRDIICSQVMFLCLDVVPPGAHHAIHAGAERDDRVLRDAEVGVRLAAQLPGSRPAAWLKAKSDDESAIHDMNKLLLYAFAVMKKREVFDVDHQWQDDRTPAAA